MEIILNLPSGESRVSELMREQDAAGWRKQVEDFLTATGTRLQLQHVDWSRHYASNADSYSAVLIELDKIEG